MGKKNLKFVLIMWIIYLLSPLLDVVRYSIIRDSNKLLAMNAVSYGLGKMFGLIMIISSGLVVWWLYSDYQRDKVFISWEKIFISITGGLSLLVASYLIHIESINYPNYLYSHYGLRTERLQIYSLVGTIIALMSIVILVVKSRKKTIQGWDKISGFLLYLGFASLLMSSALTIVKYPVYVKTSEMDYYDKFGEEYKYLDYLMKNTELESNIILPKQSSDWPVLGNQPVARYFLFPRTLYSSGIVTNSIKPHAAYVLHIQRNNDTWPFVNLKEKCIVLLKDTGECIKYSELKEVSSSQNMRLFKIITL